MRRKSLWRLMKKANCLMPGSWIPEVWWQVLQCSRPGSLTWQVSHSAWQQQSPDSKDLRMDHCRLTRSPSVFPEPCKSNSNPKDEERTTKQLDSVSGELKFYFILHYEEIWWLLPLHHFQAVPMINLRFLVSVSLGTTVQRTVLCLEEAEWEGLFPSY